MNVLEHLATVWEEEQKAEAERISKDLGRGVEAMIISSLMHHPNEAHEFLVNAPPNLFKNPVHKKIYAVMLKLSMFYGEITMTSISQFLNEIECGIAMQISNRPPFHDTNKLFLNVKVRAKKNANCEPTSEELIEIFSKK